MHETRARLSSGVKEKCLLLLMQGHPTPCSNCHAARTCSEQAITHVAAHLRVDLLWLRSGMPLGVWLVTAEVPMESKS